MNDDELKHLWQQQPLRELTPSTAEVVSAMQSKMTLLRRCLEARDFRELVACALVMVLFGYFYFTVYRAPVSRIGVMIVIGSALFVAWKLVSTRLKTPAAPPTATLVESLEAELNSVRAQSQLLSSVWWWYILPGSIGVTVATWGLSVDIGSKIFSTLIFIAVDYGIYWLNQHEVRHRLRPLENQLESMLHSVETGEPFEETHVANLRPTVVSMMVADRAKPVDFRVGFWQLAVFGIPGVVGIWFFIMLGFAWDHPRWKTTTTVPQMATPVLSAEEADRYSAFARTIVDLLNAGDYEALLGLYAPQLKEAFPPTESLGFYTNLRTRFGTIDTFDGPAAYGYLGWTAFDLHCQQGELKMSLVLDSEDKIAGIHFAPHVGSMTTGMQAERPSQENGKINSAPMPRKLATIEKMKLFLLDLFSWQHLMWLPPFFVASLVYTRFIQKTTEQAVGISALGVHLNRGQNLILWDEIEEVLPMKFLHITNLWLITGFGEKTIMHWTPLEHHSQLKTAVECSAPPDHPIRKYLSLLK